MPVGNNKANDKYCGNCHSVESLEELRSTVDWLPALQKGYLALIQ